MSPLVSKDACMNASIYKLTEHPCTKPSYWTADPDRRLCAKCHRALFGVDPA